MVNINTIDSIDLLKLLVPFSLSSFFELINSITVNDPKITIKKTVI